MADDAIDLTTLDDEELFQLSVNLRDMIAGGHPEAVVELKDVEIERVTRRAASYPDGHPKAALALAGIAKLRAEGFSDEAQSIGG